MTADMVRAFEGDWNWVEPPTLEEMGDPTKQYPVPSIGIDNEHALRGALAISEAGAAYLGTHPGNPAVTLLARIALVIPRPGDVPMRHRRAYAGALRHVGHRAIRSGGNLALAEEPVLCKVFDGELPEPTDVFEYTALAYRERQSQELHPLGAGYATVYRGNTDSITLGWCCPAERDGRRSEIELDVGRIRAEHPGLNWRSAPVRQAGEL